MYVLYIYNIYTYIYIYISDRSYIGEITCHSFAPLLSKGWHQLALIFK